MQSSRKQEKKQSNPLKKPKLGQQQQNHHTVVSEMFISDGSASACYSQNITERLTSTLTLAKSSITLPSKETVRIIQFNHYYCTIFLSFLLLWDLLLTFLCICIVLSNHGTALLSLALCMQAQTTGRQPPLWQLIDKPKMSRQVKRTEIPMTEKLGIGQTIISIFYTA